MNRSHAVDLNTPSDAELIAAVRGGDSAAYGELFERHRDAATRLARQLTGPSDADDLVSDAFIKVLNVLKGGGGPDLAFRAYLLTAVRRLHVDKIRRGSKVTPSDELEAFDPGIPFADPAVQEFENVAASKAFASLPERWQLVLWHVEVEGQKPAEVAPLLGMSANSVSALAYRAREGLRQAYLQMHMADTAAEECRWVTERLGARVRNGLSRRDTVKVDDHLDECARCSAIYLELSEVNSNLAGILAPILLGAAASGYLASAGSGSLAAAPWLLRARHFVKGHGAVTAGSTAASAVAVTVAIIAVTSGAHPQDAASERDIGRRISPPSSNPSVPGSSNAPTSGPTASRPSGATTTHAPASTSKTGRTGDPQGRGPTGAASTTPNAALLPPATDAPAGAPATALPPGSDPAPGQPTHTTPTHTTPTHTTPTHTTPTHPTHTTTTTPPTSTPPPPPPPPDWDLKLSMSTLKMPGHRYRGTMSVSAPDEAKGITVTISVGDKVNSLFLGGAGWSCGPEFSRKVATYTCTTDDSSPAALVATVKFHPRAKAPHLDATVSAPGNDDPAPGNNSGSLSL